MNVDVGKPRGILNPKAGEEKFRLSLHPPAPDLAFFVEQYWIIDWDLRGQEPYRQEVLTHPCIHLVFESGKSQVVGVVTGKFSQLLEERGRVFGIKFKPGAFYPFVKSPVSQFTDRSIRLQDVFDVDPTALEGAILSPEDEGTMIERAEAFLRERLPERDGNIDVINRVVDRIIADRAITKVDDVSSQISLNTRTLQRIFRQYVGVSPKWVIKRYRLHEAAEQMAAGAVVDWPTLALDLGYFDQAHFIRDFRTLVGRTPAEYAKTIDRDS